MRILIEEYQYAYDDVKDVIKGVDIPHDTDKKVSIPYVGYYFNPNPEVNDCVFILPKVLLEGPFGQEKVFGHIKPEKLILADKCEELSTEESKFIYELSVWIYRAICVFKRHEYDRSGEKKNTPSIVLHNQVQMVGGGRRQKQRITFLDVLLELQRWNKENEQFVMFILKNIHAGYNKINWTRTIAKTPAILQEPRLGYARQDITYIRPINKKRQINFDEELLVIYFSILQYMKDEYGFPVKINVNFPLIRGRKFEKYLNGYGCRRLKQIKYKYFSDKALELWNLCYDFFSRPMEASLRVDQKEYLLVRSFHVVFEAIIDELIAGDQHLPKELLDQPDGKRVDHMYQYKELTRNDTDDKIYYIGDSKYYKRNNTLGSESIYKQFTYARNVIQWNINLFIDGTPEEQQGHIKLRDDETEGYNIIPNFFISANQNELKPIEEIKLIDGERHKQYYLSRQFENRLYDRDTFLLAHYDVNFLFVVALYGRDNATRKAEWRAKVRKLFRKEIQQLLKENFEFYAMTAHADVSAESYIKEHFQMILGKVFHPFENREGSDQQYYSLALRKPDEKMKAELRTALQEENEQVLFAIKDSFYVVKCELGTDPRTLSELPKVNPIVHVDVPKEYLTMHWLEKYPNDYIVVGGYNGVEQLNWVFSRQGGKRDDAYNVRLGGKEVHGSVVKSRDYVKHAKFAILYDFEKKAPTYTFRVKNTGEMTKEKMIETGYKNPHQDRYFCYFFDEEITLGVFDIEAIVKADMEKPGYVEGRPIYLSGKELINFRR